MSEPSQSGVGRLGSTVEVDDYALRCAVDALYHEQYPDSPIDRHEHGFPAPIYGPVRNHTRVVVEAYVKALARRHRG